MNTLRRALIALSIPTLASLAATQSPCFPATSPIQNAGFEALDSLLYPWTLTGTAIYEDGQTVDGRNTSRCLRAETAITATQPVPFALTGGVAYEFGFDVESLYSGSVAYSLQIFDDAGAFVHGSGKQYTGGVGRRRRVMTRFTPTVDGEFTVRINASWRSRIDNLYVREQPVMLTFTNQRRAAVENDLVVTGPNNANFAVFLSLGGKLPQGFALPSLCDGAWWLAGPVFTLTNGALSNAGSYTLPLTIPVELEAAALEWQAALLPPTCSFGCPSTFDFF